MTKVEIIKELDMLEAMADSMKQKAISLRGKLGAVSTPPTPKRQKYSEAVAKVLANRAMVINKRLPK